MNAIDIAFDIYIHYYCFDILYNDNTIIIYRAIGFANYVNDFLITLIVKRAVISIMYGLPPEATND